MLNQTNITKTTGAAPTQILFNVQNQMAVSIIVSKNTTNFVTENGRKIVKAGTPLYGNLEDRAMPHGDASEMATGILLHDVDITDDDANGSLLIWGFVNLDRIDENTAALITLDVKQSLNGRVFFLKDN